MLQQILHSNQIYRFNLKQNVLLVKSVRNINQVVLQSSGNEYLVQWKGYDASSNTWEPASNLANCKELVASFHLNFKPVSSAKKLSTNKANSKKVVKKSVGKKKISSIVPPKPSPTHAIKARATRAKNRQ